MATGRGDIWGQFGDDQTLAYAPAYYRLLSPKSSSWSSSYHSSGTTRRFVASTSSEPGRNRGPTYAAMERHTQGGAQFPHPQSCDPPLGLDPQKKTLGATERDEQARAASRARVAVRDADDFIVGDECGSNINLTPLYARAPRGQRAFGTVPRNTQQNTTLIASMTLSGMGPAMLLRGATDTAAFEAYVEHVLAPTLTPGKVVVIDNLSAHKSTQVRVLIEARGCEIWFLPAYSPDLSPIEEAFSKLKALLPRAEARTRAVLEQAIAEALGRITSPDAQGYFAHCGYGISLAQ